MKHEQLAQVASAWLRANAHSKARLPKNLTKFTYRTIGAGIRVHGTLGMALQESAATGLLVHLSDEHFCLKEGRNKFAFGALSGFAHCPTLREGVNVVATPYNERDLDGIPLGEVAKCDQVEGLKTMLIGVRHQSLGVIPKTQVVRALAHQLCTLPMPGGARTLLGALIDAGARRESLAITENDETGEYRISLDVATQAFAGRFTIGYDCESDLYWIELAPAASSPVQEVRRHEGVYFDDIGRFIEDFVQPPKALGTFLIPQDQD